MSTTPVNPPTQPDPNNPSPNKPKDQPQPAGALLPGFSTWVTPAAIASAFMNLTPEQQKAGVDANKDHHHHHFWKAFVDSLGNAIGEAKFGG